MPRLADLRLAHPDLNLMIDPSANVVELSPGGIDVALRYGSGVWAGVTSEMLLKTPIVVVGAPALLEGREIASPDDLAAFPWLEELGTSEATNWLKSQGAEHGFVKNRVQLPGNLVLDAARSGQGLAVSNRKFVEPDVAAGRLEILFEDTDSDAGYHIVTRPGVLRPAARSFISWLRQAVKTDAA